MKQITQFFLEGESPTLTTFENWLGNTVDEHFNPMSTIIDHQEKQSHRLERVKRNSYRTFLALGEHVESSAEHITKLALFQGSKR